MTTARHLTYRQVLPGALTAAVIWQLLQSFGASYVSHVTKNASATNGVFALVLGLIAWLFIEAVAVVFGVEVNVVRAQHLHPRALMTPFTDNVDLTRADRGQRDGHGRHRDPLGLSRALHAQQGRLGERPRRPQVGVSQRTVGVSPVSDTIGFSASIHAPMPPRTLTGSKPYCFRYAVAFSDRPPERQTT